MPTMPIEDIPPKEVGEVVQSFVDNGGEHLEVRKQPDGNFTVIPVEKNGD